MNANAPNRSTLAPALLAATAFGLALPLGATAQQQPLTSHMMGGQQATAITPATAVPPASIPTGTASVPPPPPAEAAAADDRGTAMGAATRHLLQMQVDGRHAGRRLPTLGAEASASYRRYLDSFNHPIPEFYETTIGKNGNDGR